MRDKKFFLLVSLLKISYQMKKSLVIIGENVHTRRNAQLARVRNVYKEGTFIKTCKQEGVGIE
jgi:hypothetical protein